MSSYFDENSRRVGRGGGNCNMNVNNHEGVVSGGKGSMVAFNNRCSFSGAYCSDFKVSSSGYGDGFIQEQGVSLGRDAGSVTSLTDEQRINMNNNNMQHNIVGEMNNLRFNESLKPHDGNNHISNNTNFDNCNNICSSYCKENTTTGNRNNSESMQDVMMKMVLESMKDNIRSEACSQVSSLQRYFPASLSRLRLYFDVSHYEVRQRLVWWFFPLFCDWKSSVFICFLSRKLKKKKLSTDFVEMNNASQFNNDNSSKNNSNCILNENFCSNNFVGSTSNDNSNNTCDNDNTNSFSNSNFENKNKNIIHSKRVHNNNYHEENYGSIVAKRDLYTPLMALITYILLASVYEGINKKESFSPLILRATGSYVLLLLFVEVFTARICFYFGGWKLKNFKYILYSNSKLSKNSNNSDGFKIGYRSTNATATNNSYDHNYYNHDDGCESNSSVNYVKSNNDNNYSKNNTDYCKDKNNIGKSESSNISTTYTMYDSSCSDDNRKKDIRYSDGYSTLDFLTIFALKYAHLVFLGLFYLFYSYYYSQILSAQQFHLSSLPFFRVNYHRFYESFTADKNTVVDDSKSNGMKKSNNSDLNINNDGRNMGNDDSAINETSKRKGSDTKNYANGMNAVVDERHLEDTEVDPNSVRSDLFLLNKHALSRYLYVFVWLYLCGCLLYEVYRHLNFYISVCKNDEDCDDDTDTNWNVRTNKKLRFFHYFILIFTTIQVPLFYLLTPVLNNT